MDKGLPGTFSIDILIRKLFSLLLLIIKDTVLIWGNNCLLLYTEERDVRGQSFWVGLVSKTRDCIGLHVCLLFHLVLVCYSYLLYRSNCGKNVLRIRSPKIPQREFSLNTSKLTFWTFTESYLKYNFTTIAEKHKAMGRSLEVLELLRTPCEVLKETRIYRNANWGHILALMALSGPCTFEDG